MIVNAAIFTCSICGEASVNICSYCTKDACANHRCERCKRCSDCCECEVPLSAEEAVSEPVAEAPGEAAPPVEPSIFTESSVFAEPSVFAETTTDPEELPYLSDHDDLTEPGDPAEPR